MQLVGHLREYFQLLLVENDNMRKYTNLISTWISSGWPFPLESFDYQASVCHSDCKSPGIWGYSKAQDRAFKGCCVPQLEVVKLKDLQAGNKYSDKSSA